MIDGCMLDEVFDKNEKIIGSEKIDDTKMLIDRDDKLSHITLKIVVILMTSVR